MDFYLHCDELSEIHEKFNLATSMVFHDYEKAFDKFIRNIQRQIKTNFPTTLNKRGTPFASKIIKVAIARKHLKYKQNNIHL